MSLSPSELEVLYGTREPPANPRLLRAGSLSVELEGGQLRYVRWNGVEVLRAISFLVRDENWGTYATAITDLTVTETAAAFEVVYRGQCAPDAGDLRFRAVIAGDADGCLRFEVTGSPAADLRTNRAGFVVLHPLAGVIGVPIEVEHTDGRRETVTLSAAISPHEPIRGIFALTHGPAPGVSARVEMTGDAYDMEDQRNWTDASLKSYIRPLSQPWPYVLPAGKIIAQSVTLVLSGQAAKVTAEPRLHFGWAPTDARFPRIGLAVEGGDLPGAIAQIDKLRGVGAGRLIARPVGLADLDGFTRLQRELDIPLTLEFAIPAVSPRAELERWAAAADAVGLVSDSVCVTPFRLYPLRPADAVRGDATLAEIARAARETFPDASIGGGVLTAFTEFNRNRPPIGDIDYVSHTTSAIVHAADDRSVMESLETLPYVFASARAIAGTAPYRAGPSVIGLALNPDGPPRRREAGQGRSTMVRNDPRHAALFGAAWGIGYAARAAEQVEELSLAHATGDFGIIGSQGELRPLYQVLRGLCRGQGAVVLRVETGDEGLQAVGFAGSRGREVWLANLTPEIRSLEVPHGAVVSTLDASNATAAVRDATILDSLAVLPGKLDLGPFAAARMVLP